MKTAKELQEYQREFKLFDEELNDFISFLNDPNRETYHPISRIIVKCEDGGLCLHMGRHNSTPSEHE